MIKYLFLFLIPSICLPATIGGGSGSGTITISQTSAGGTTIINNNGINLTNVNGEFIVTQNGALGGTNDDTVVFQSLLSVQGAVVIIPYNPDGFTVGNLHITNSVTFINRGSVLFFKTNALGACVDTHYNTNIIIDGLRVDGMQVSNYVSQLTANLVLLPNPELYFMQNRYGIRVNMEANAVRDCKVSNFSGACYDFYNKNAGSSEAFHMTDFAGNNALNSMLGFNFNAFTNSEPAEYSSVSRLNASGCAYGIKIGAGNVRVSASTFSANGVGHLLQGGNNSAHGQFVGCTFNHNVFPIYAEGNLNGELYVGCDVLANTGPLYINGIAGFRMESCQFSTIKLFITNTIPGAVFVPSVSICNSYYQGLWASQNITNASDAYLNMSGNWSMDRVDNDLPREFVTINTGDFRPQLSVGNVVSNSSQATTYFMGRRNADGYWYEVGEQSAAATGVVLQHTKGAGDLGTTYASILGTSGFVSMLSDIETNTAPYAIRTNEFVLNTFYTNFAQRAYVQVTVGLLSGVGGNAQVSLYIDQEQNGSFERTGISEALTGIAASATNSLGAFIQPSGRFVFTNLSGGGGVANIQANSSEWVRQ